MEPSNDDPRRALAFRLVGSVLWRQVLDDVYLPDYARASQALDTATTDQRYYQGFKAAMRLMIEWPFQLTETESPLVPLKAPPRRRRPPRPQEDILPPMTPLPRRQGVLA